MYLKVTGVTGVFVRSCLPAVRAPLLPALRCCPPYHIVRTMKVRIISVAEALPEGYTAGAARGSCKGKKRHRKKN